jgi:hypothetical protein
MSNTTNKKTVKNILKYWYLLVVLVLIGSILAQEASAQTMTNGNYTIQMGNLNMSAGRPTGSGYKLLFTAGQTSPGLYSGTNYKVRAGFEYILSIIHFRFRIDSTFIDFGTISPTIPVLRTNTLTVTNGSAFGYQVTVSQNHNLRVNASGAEIPPTACDGPSCTTTTAASWTNSLAYGFGYRCNNVSGTDCDSQFLASSDYYKPFIASPSAIAVMSSPNVGNNKISQVVYKVNVSGSQAAGLYQNIINYIATPTF